MGEYTLGYLLIAIVTIAMVITGTSIFMSDVITQYDVDSDTVQNFSSIGKLQEMQSNIRDISGSLQNTTSDPDITDSTKGIASGTWSSIWLTFKSVGILKDMASETYEALPTDVGTDQAGNPWFFGGLAVIMSVIIIGAIWATVTGRNMF